MLSNRSDIVNITKFIVPKLARALHKFKITVYNTKFIVEKFKVSI